MNNDWSCFFIIKEKVSYVSDNDKEKNLTDSGMLQELFSKRA